MRRRCDGFAGSLLELVDGGRLASPKLRRHVDRCLRCQAELARHRRLARLLAQLRHDREELPQGLVADVLASVERAARRGAARSVLAGRRIALAGCTAAGLVLAGAAVIGLGRRSAARA